MSNTTEPFPVHPSGKPSSPSSDVYAAPVPSGSSNQALRLLQIPQRYWPACVVILTVSAAIAYAADRKLYQPLWLVKGTLVHTPLPLTEVQKSVYTPIQSMATYMELLKTPRVHEPVREKYGLRMTAEMLASRTFGYDQPHGTETIDVSLKWPDGEAGAGMVNTLMDSFIAHLVHRRKDLIKEALADREGSLDACKQNLERAEADLKRMRLLDKQQEVKPLLDALEREIANETAALATAQRTFDTSSAQLKKVEEQLERLRQADPADLSGYEGDASYLDKKRQVSEQIRTEEKKLRLIAPELTNAKLDYERNQRLGSAAARKDLEESKAKYERLLADRRNSEEDLKRYKGDLARLPLLVAEGKLPVLRDQRDTARGEIEQAKAKLAALAEKKKDFEMRLRGLEPLDRKIKEIEAERVILENQVRALRQLSTVTGSEFRVEAYAKASVDPYTSNRKRVLAVAFGLPFALLFGLLIGYDLLLNVRTAEAAGKLGLPVLGHLTRTPTPQGEFAYGIDPKDARGLALRLRQYVSEEGGTILFSSLCEGRTVDDLAFEVARVLAMRDEKVLILDARINNPQDAGLPVWVEKPAPLLDQEEPEDPASAGLVQYLVFEGQDPQDFIWPTEVNAVDYMPAGGPYPVTDVLASQSMKDLFEALRRKYSLILVTGPALTYHVDTEILAAYVHGIVIVLNGPANRLTPGLVTFFQSLKEANAPLLGTVVDQ